MSLPLSAPKQPRSASLLMGMRGRVRMEEFFAMRVFLLSLLALCQSPAGDGAIPPGGQLPITRAGEVLALTPQQTGSNLPVQLTGVVTAADSSWNGAFFVQDETAGIFVDTTGKGPAVGDEVELRGIIEPGAYAPIVARAHWQITGRAPLPAPRKVTIEDLMTGAEDGQRVEVSGWVHRVIREDGLVFLDLASGANRVKARIPDGMPFAPESLIGCKVSATGVPTANSLNFNVRRMVSVRLWLHSPGDLVILQQAAPLPRSAQRSTISELSHYRTDNSPGKRYLIRGVVTYVGEGFFYASDETGGVEVRSEESAGLKPGDLIEAVGFPILERGLPVFSDATISPQEGRAEVEPVVLESVKQLRDGLFAGSLVKVTGRLVNSLVRYAENSTDLQQVTLAMQTGEGIFAAELMLPPEEVNSALHPVGTVLEVTGVCAVTTDQNGSFQSFQILVPSPADIRVVQAASPFTTGRLLVALVILLVIMLVVAVWNIRLLRKNTRLSGDVRERNAVLAERARLAGDLHDTLEQSLTGLGFQLQTTSKLINQDPGRALDHLKIATEGIQQIHSELRHSIWNLTPGILKQFNLAEAVARNIRQTAESAGLDFTESAVGKPPRLDPFIQENIFRIAQEAATNAVKHAQATRIDLRVEMAPDRIFIRIADNGKGMGSVLPGSERAGGFGLSGMKERATRVGGRIEFSKNTPAGTVVTLEVPVNARAASALAFFSL